MHPLKRGRFEIYFQRRGAEHAEDLFFLCDLGDSGEAGGESSLTHKFSKAWNIILAEGLRN